MLGAEAEREPNVRIHGEGASLRASFLTLALDQPLKLETCVLTRKIQGSVSALKFERHIKDLLKMLALNLCNKAIYCKCMFEDVLCRFLTPVRVHFLL